MRYDNLPFFDWQQSFFSVRSVREYQRGVLPRLDCDSDSHTYTVRAVLLNATKIDDGTVSIDRVESSADKRSCDNVDCVYKVIYVVNSMPSVTCVTSNTDVLVLLRGVTTHEPMYVQDALNIIDRKEVHCDNGLSTRHNYRPTRLGREPYTRERFRSELMRSDFDKVRIDMRHKLTGSNITQRILDVMRADKMKYAHVLTVNDCTNVCVTSGLSDYRVFFDYNAHNEYGQHMEQSIFNCLTSLKYLKSPFLPITYMSDLWMSSLPALDSQEFYTIVRTLKDTRYSWQPQVPYDCTQRTFEAAKCEYVGYAFSIVRRAEAGMLARVKHYKYSVRCESEHSYSVKDMKMTQRDVFDTDITPFSILSSLYFARNPADFGRLAAMSSVLDKRDMLYMRVDGVDHKQQLKAVLSKQQNEYNTIDRHNAAVLINDIHVSEEQDINLQEYVSNTYVNIIHNCERICLQTRLSDVEEFMPYEIVQSHGLLCLHEIQNANNTAENAIAIRRTTTSTVAPSTSTVAHNISTIAQNISVVMQNISTVTQNTTWPVSTDVCDAMCCARLEQQNTIDNYTASLGQYNATHNVTNIMTCNPACCASMWTNALAARIQNSHTRNDDTNNIMAPLILVASVITGLSVSALIIGKSRVVFNSLRSSISRIRAALHNYHNDSNYDAADTHELDVNVTTVGEILLETEADTLLEDANSAVVT